MLPFQLSEAAVNEKAYVFIYKNSSMQHLHDHFPQMMHELATKSIVIPF